MSSSAEENINKTISIRTIDNWNKGNLDGYLQLYDPQAVLRGYIGVEPGLESIKKFYQRFWIAFSGLQITIDDIIAEGDKLACRFTATGIHTDELMETAPTGKSVKFMGITILKSRKAMYRKIESS
jgi:hypothetical protein